MKPKNLVFFLAVLAVMLGVTLLWPMISAAQAPEGREYTVQADDWLSKIAEKELGDVLAYTAIMEATNAKAAEDDSFAVIADPNIIEIGQKLWIPPTAEQPETAPAEATDSGDMAVVSTEVITFMPTAMPAETQAGSCFTNAIGLGREDAYRCTVGNIIYDPCFVIDDAPTVICGADPTTGDIGFVLALTEPLPAPETNATAMPWLLELADGQVCGLMTGTVPVVGERVAPYGCPDQSYLFEDIQQGEVWLAEKAVISLNDDGFFIEQSEMAPITRVWQ